MKLIISKKTFYLINEIHSRNPNYLLHLFLESYLNNKNMCDDEINDFHINSIGIVKPNYIKNEKYKNLIGDWSSLLLRYDNIKKYFKNNIEEYNKNIKLIKNTIFDNKDLFYYSLDMEYKNIN